MRASIPASLPSTLARCPPTSKEGGPCLVHACEQRELYIRRRGIRKTTMSLSYSDFHAILSQMECWDISLQMTEHDVHRDIISLKGYLVRFRVNRRESPQIIRSDDHWT